MIVHFYHRGERLLSRPMLTIPLPGDDVALTPPGGTPQCYTVQARRRWALPLPPREYYSVLDEADGEVSLVLEEGGFDGRVYPRTRRA